MKRITDEELARLKARRVELGVKNMQLQAMAAQVEADRRAFDHAIAEVLARHGELAAESEIDETTGEIRPREKRDGR